MRANRGTTIIEVLLATVMVTVLILGTTSLFGYVAQRVTADTTQTAVYSQASALADELTNSIRQAKLCDLQTLTGMTALRCEMPGSGVDTNQDGVLDICYPSSYDYLTDTETFTTGKYVWFYMANSAGTWGSSGTTLWRATPATSAAPVVGDMNTNWAKYYGGNPKWNFIDSVTYVVDTANEKVTFTINASSLNRAERSASAATGSSDNSKVTLTRTVFWRNYR